MAGQIFEVKVETMLEDYDTGDVLGLDGLMDQFGQWVQDELGLPLNLRDGVEISRVDPAADFDAMAEAHARDEDGEWIRLRSGYDHVYVRGTVENLIRFQKAFYECEKARALRDISYREILGLSPEFTDDDLVVTVIDKDPGNADEVLQFKDCKMYVTYK